MTEIDLPKVQFQLSTCDKLVYTAAHFISQLLLSASRLPYSAEQTVRKVQIVIIVFAFRKRKRENKTQFVSQPLTRRVFVPSVVVAQQSIPAGLIPRLFIWQLKRQWAMKNILLLTIM